MTFSNLHPSDKEAFFTLLDEYFSSRQGLFDLASTGLAGTTGGTSNDQQAGYSVVITQRHSPPSKDVHIVPRLPTRTSSSSDTRPVVTTPQVSANRTNQAGKLVSHKNFGDVDLSSGKNMIVSLRKSTANKSAVPPPVAPHIPSAFGQKRNAYGPPPVRRVSSSTVPSVEVEPISSSTTVYEGADAGQDKQDAKANGEWAEALYDYNSGDAGDLSLREHQLVRIVERTSDDWWTGESDGSRGLFPAAYVKMV